MRYLASPLPLVEVDYTSVGASYGGTNLIVRPAGDPRTCTKIIVSNKTDADIFVSTDGGVNAHFVVPSDETVIIDNALFNNVQVKRYSGAPTSGKVRFTFFVD